jgi:hypothetical protein
MTSFTKREKKVFYLLDLLERLPHLMTRRTEISLPNSIIRAVPSSALSYTLLYRILRSYIPYFLAPIVIVLDWT